MNKNLILDTQKALQLAARLVAAQNLYKKDNCCDSKGRLYVNRSVKDYEQDKYVCIQDDAPMELHQCRLIVGDPSILKEQLTSVLKSIPESYNNPNDTTRSSYYDPNRVAESLSTLSVHFSSSQDPWELPTNSYCLSLVLSVLKDLGTFNKSFLKDLAKEWRQLTGLDVEIWERINQDFFLPRHCLMGWDEEVQDQCPDRCLPMPFQDMCYVNLKTDYPYSA